ncbi:putative protein phosphatase 2C 33 [Zea mays]|uniref:protein-serine/threonine phosphatase n=1 Tax=Zea mays TaxID=4577 RepID=A0A1D6HCQ1_MAIZE|nr:putative protein phosphatase 2C 33 [Zea mays]
MSPGCISSGSSTKSYLYSLCRCAFDDYYIKDCGVISAPEVTPRRTNRNYQFVVIATVRVAFVPVWDVLSNNEIMQIVAYIEVYMILMVAMQW